MAHRGPVSSVSRDALAVTSLSRCRTATTSATSGSRRSPDSPTISTGTPAAVSASKTSAACALSRVSTPMSDHSSVPVATVHLRHGLREPGQLLALGLEDSGGDDAVVGLRLGLERPHRVGAGVEGLGQTVGDREDPAVGSPVDRERVGRHGTGRGGEGLREAEDVGDRGTAPPVDRLVGVADRGDRMAAAGGSTGTREEPREHHRLRDGRVLVLVEEHNPELVPLGGADLGLVGGEPGAELDLVGEVHQPEVGLHPPVAGNQVEQLAAALDGVGGLLHHADVRRPVLALALLLRCGPEPGERLAVDPAHVVGPDQVLAHLAVEVEEGLDDCLGVVAQVGDHAGVPVHHPRTELVAGRVGDDPGVRLVPDPQPVVGQQAGGVGVVGRDGGLQDVLVLGRGVVERPCIGQRLADLGAELTRGLGGEREAEGIVVGRTWPVSTR